MPQNLNHRSPRRRRQKKGHEKILEKIIVENFSKMGKEKATQFQETQTVPNRINPRRIKIHTNQMTKIKEKEKILKATRERNNIQNNPHKIIS